MAVRVSNCGHDEKNGYSGGVAGDQTGTEWYLRPWYSYPWNYIIRWKDETLGNLCADLAIEAALNDLIGYDQWQRWTFWDHLKASSYRPKNIKKACEADCSSGTIAIIRAIGYLMGIPELQNCNATYTGDMMTFFNSAAGKKYFEVLTGKYLTDSSMAKRGDINLNTAHHVNITVDNGANAGKTTSKGYLSKGDTGSEVKTMQTMLIACGYSCGASGADGDFGNDTEVGLMIFQSANGLETDGKYGPLSKARLEAIYKNLTSSVSKQDKTQRLFAGKVTASELNVRTWAGTEYTQIKSFPVLKKDTLVDVMNYTQKDTDGADWYYVRIKKGSEYVFGFVHSKYIQKQ